MTSKRIKFLSIVIGTAFLASSAIATPALAGTESISEPVVYESQSLNEISDAASNVTIPDNTESYTINKDKTYSFYESSSDRYIWYKFTLDRTIIGNFTSSYELKSNSLPSLYIFDKTGTEMCDIYPGYADSYADYTALRKGTYYIRLYIPYGISGSITFNLSETEPDKYYQSFVEDYEDASTLNDSYTTSDEITQSTAYHGILGSNNSVDWYKLNVTDAAADFSFTQTVFKGYGIHVRIYDMSREEKYADQEVSNGEVFNQNLKKGSYYVEVTNKLTSDSPNPETVHSYIINPDGSESSDKPSERATERRGDFQFTYYHLIPFWGRSKLALSSLGEITASYNGVEYKVSKATVNKKKHTIRIRSLEGADKSINKAVKKITGGSGVLTFTVKPYIVTAVSKVSIKKKKDGTVKAVKVTINGKPYSAKKNEFEYDSSSKTITFKGDNISGSYTIND